MLQAQTLQFLNTVIKNNNKPWFDAHRTQYETARADFKELVEKLIISIGIFDAPIGQLEAKNCLFRINRDVRFSKDKRPYKNNFACYFNFAGKKGNGAGYYLHIEPGNSFAAGGIWMPESPVLAGIRQEIDYNFRAWKKVIENKNFKTTFTEGLKSETSLVRPPKGYDEINPAIEYLKMKSFIVTKHFPDKLLQDKFLLKEVTGTFKTMKPLIDFINTSLH